MARYETPMPMVGGRTYSTYIYSNSMVLLKYRRMKLHTKLYIYKVFFLDQSLGTY